MKLSFSQKKTLIHNKTPLIYIDIHPLKHELHSRIEKYYQVLTQHWLQRWEHVQRQRGVKALELAQEKGFIFRPWFVQLTHTITYQDEKYISILTQIEEHQMGQHPFQVYTACTWQKREGVPCPYSIFLPWTHTQMKQKLSIMMENRIETEPTLFFPEAITLVKNYFSPHRYYLTPKGVCFFYPMKMLGSLSEGIPVFMVDFPEK